MALKHLAQKIKCLNLHQNSVFRIDGNMVKVRNITLSATKSLDQRWREKRGLPMNPNSHGILTDGPDYTFLDGRPTPYGSRQKRRLIKQREIAECIITLSKEVDFAVERHKQLQFDEENKRKQIISKKLKAKGSLLLANK